MRYLLSKDAHLCTVADHVVLLDLRTGKYFSLSASQAREAEDIVDGWPRLHSVAAAGTNALPSLVDRGLVTPEPHRGKSACPVSAIPPLEWLGEFRPRGRPQVRAIQVVRFARAAATAAFLLRFRGMRRIVDRCTRRKEASGASRSTCLSSEHLTELIRVFDWLRPLAFHRQDTCLLYTLAMLEFLACHGVYPDWIFGVRLHPFKAHCWIQHDTSLLTDIPFNTGHFTPIMVV